MSRVSKVEVIQSMIDMHKRSLDFYANRPLYNSVEDREDQKRRIEDKIQYWEKELENANKN